MPPPSWPLPPGCTLPTSALQASGAALPPPGVDWSPENCRELNRKKQNKLKKEWMSGLQHHFPSSHGMEEYFLLLRKGA